MDRVAEKRAAAFYNFVLPKAYQLWKHMVYNTYNTKITKER